MKKRRLAVAAGVFGIVTGVVIWVGTRRPEPPPSVWGVPLLPTAGQFDVFRYGPSSAAHSELVAVPWESERDRYAKVLIFQVPSSVSLVLHELWNSYVANVECLGTYSATGETRDIDGKTWRKFVLDPK